MFKRTFIPGRAPDPELSPGRAPDPQFSPVRSPDPPFIPISAPDPELSPGRAPDSSFGPVRSPDPQFSPGRASDLQLSPTIFLFCLGGGGGGGSMAPALEARTGAGALEADPPWPPEFPAPPWVPERVPPWGPSVLSPCLLRPPERPPPSAPSRRGWVIVRLVSLCPVFFLPYVSLCPCLVFFISLLVSVCV